jgi:hypothetical protein
MQSLFASMVTIPRTPHRRAIELQRREWPNRQLTTPRGWYTINVSYEYDRADYDRASEVLAKVQDWLDAGCRAVWVADPQTRSVTVYRGQSVIEIFRPCDQLTDGDLLPGFRLAVAEIFA